MAVCGINHVTPHFTLSREERRRLRRRPGERVIIVGGRLDLPVAEQPRDLLATYLGRFDYPNKRKRYRGPRDMGNPLMMTDDGRYYWGCECWWIPVRLANEARKAAGLPLVEEAT